MVNTRHITGSITNTIKAACGNEEDTICACWWESKNWGDALNPVLIQLLSGKKPILMSDSTLNIRHRPIYAVIGSILQNINSRLIKDTIVFGAGLISDSSKLSGVPREICAIRGPHTREIILKQGIKCPEVYGDPALLYPTFYKPEKRSKYRLGIIPHYVDKNSSFIKNIGNIPEVQIIDIEGPINEVVDQICNCRYIASSSLHGIIIADAYGIPSTWMKLSEGVVGNGFKFVDYFSSVGRNDTEPFIVAEKTTIEDIIDSTINYKIDFDRKNLIDKCPFYYQ